MTTRRGLLAGGLGVAALSAAFAGAAWVAPTTRDRSGPTGSGLLDAARQQLGVTQTYDPGYSRIAYPRGDVPRRTGVCADVVIRAARDGFGLDLQRLVHEDMIRAFDAYPHRWGLSQPDPNIDHRRVPNLATYWRRHGAERWRSGDAKRREALRPGDILTFVSARGNPHVAIIVHGGTLPRVIHNMGWGVREQPLWTLFGLRQTGLYRWPLGAERLAVQS